MRNFSNLSDHDFEMLVGDLLGEELSVRFERFTRGADTGIDLRSPMSDNGRHVVQCKHYLQSAGSHLRTAAKQERERLVEAPADARLRVSDTYWFVTSMGLSPNAKASVVALLDPFVPAPEQILARDDLEGLLDKHPDVERRQIKLWLDNWNQLDGVLHAGRHRRSQALLEEIAHRIGRYVPPSIYPDASRRVSTEGVLVIAGAPGIGKTTLAHMLVAEAVASGFQVIEVVSDIDEAWTALEPSRKQLFYYDDFLGRTGLEARLGKNEDSQLVRFMQFAAREPNVRFVLTTREHILQDAAALYERLAHHQLHASRILIELRHYTAVERARIVTGHLQAAGLERFDLRGLWQDARRWPGGRGYWDIVLHPNFSPRQVEWICGLGPYKAADASGADFQAFAVSALDDPSDLWTYAFETELTEVQRVMTLVASTLPRRFSLVDLEAAWSSACFEYNLSIHSRAFQRCLGVLEGTVIATHQEASHTFGQLFSPGIEDFAKHWLLRAADDVRALLRSFVFFEQVTWLWEALGTWGEPPEETYLPLFTDAAVRTYDTDTSVWSVRELTAGSQVAQRERSFEGQLSALSQMRRARVADWEALRDLWETGLSRLVEHWRQGQGARDEVLSCARMLSNTGELADEAAEAIRSNLLGDLSSPSHFLAAAQLRKIDDSFFTPPMWDEVKATLERILAAEPQWDDLETAECVDYLLHERSDDSGLLFPGLGDADPARANAWHASLQLYNELKASGEADAVDAVFDRLLDLLCQVLDTADH